MKIMKFREFFMQEEVTLPIAHGTIDITNQATMLNINTLLARALDQEFLTPYIALEKVRQVLARFSVYLEGTTKLFDGDEGSFTFAVMQFGEVVDNTPGKDQSGIEVDKTRFIYFAWELNEEGTFEVFASLVTSEELEELLDDEDEEDAEDEEESALEIDPVEFDEAVKAEKPGITMTKIGNNKNFHFQYKGFDWQGTAWDKKEAYSKGMDAYEKSLGTQTESFDHSKVKHTTRWFNRSWDAADDETEMTVHELKDGSYYGENGKFDFQAKNKHEAERKLKYWGYTK